MLRSHATGMVCTPAVIVAGDKRGRPQLRKLTGGPQLTTNFFVIVNAKSN